MCVALSYDTDPWTPVVTVCSSWSFDEEPSQLDSCTVRHRGMETGISEASKRVSIFSFATQGGKQVSFYFRQGNWVQALEAQIRLPAGGLEFDSIE